MVFFFGVYTFLLSLRVVAATVCTLLNIYSKSYHIILYCVCIFRRIAVKHNYLIESTSGFPSVNSGTFLYPVAFFNSTSSSKIFWCETIFFLKSKFFFCKKNKENSNQRNFFFFFVNSRKVYVFSLFIVRKIDWIGFLCPSKFDNTFRSWKKKMC